MKSRRIKRKIKTAADHGNCEICGIDCGDTAYIQQWSEKGSRDYHNWIIGHLTCLLSGKWALAPVID